MDCLGLLALVLVDRCWMAFTVGLLASRIDSLTRLETRTKESNVCASVVVQNYDAQ